MGEPRVERLFREAAVGFLRADVMDAITTARRELSDEEVAQALESVLRRWFMARVYPR